MNAGPAIGHAIAAAARSFNQSQTLDETLTAITHAARDSVPGFDQVGISTLYKNGKVETRAATGKLVHELDSIQYTLAEGPCVDTLREAHVVVAPHIGHDQRWPRYVPAAVERGLRAQLAVRLYLDDQGTLGGLNLSRRHPTRSTPRPRQPPSSSRRTRRSPSATPANGRTSTRPSSPARSSGRPSAS